MGSDIFSLATGEYLEELPEDCELLKEDYSSLTQGCCPSDIPLLVSAVQDLVGAISKGHSSEVSRGPDTFGVHECATRLGCSSGFVRTLVRQGKLQHHWLGKNLRFRQQDVELFWGFQTSAGASKRSVTAKRDTAAVTRSAKREGPAQQQVPSIGEINGLWR